MSVANNLLQIKCVYINIWPRNVFDPYRIILIDDIKKVRRNFKQIFILS